MCLTAEKGKIFRANQDIACFKIVYLEDNGKWTGAYGYSDKEFEFDKVLSETNGHPKPKKGDSDIVELGGGYFHSYSKKYDRAFVYKAYNYCATLRKIGGYPAKMENLVMCECTIPKGTVFYKDCISGDFASRKIIVHKPKE